MSGSDEPGERLRAGAQLVIQDSRGIPFEVTVRQVREGSLVVEIDEGLPVPDEEVLVEHRVKGEGCFRTRAEFTRSESRAEVHPLESWIRDNDREFVRVRTYGIQVEIRNPLANPERSAGSGNARGAALLDVSAGGALLEAAPQFEAGEQVVCHFELPGEACFALPARVVRADEADAAGKGQVAVEFEGLAEDLRSALLRWVYRQQTRRSRRS